MSSAIDPDNWLWAVEWDDHHYRFETFAAAKEFLEKELLWLADDLADDRTWEAWQRVSRWQRVDGKKYKIKAGDPPSTYKLRPRRGNE